MSTRALQSDPETLETFRKVLLRSSAYAIAAYFISFIFEKGITVCVALLKNFSVNLRYNYLKISADQGAWDQETVLLIYLIPFFFHALIFVLLYIRFLNIEFKSRYSKIFLLWLMFFIIYRLLGLFPGHLIFKTGINYALNWLYFSLALKIVTGLISTGLFLLTGFQILRGILALSGTYHYHIRDMGIPNLILSSLIIPLYAVCLIAGLFYLPKLPGDEILGFFLVIILSIYIFIKLYSIDPNLFSFKEKVEENGNPVWIMTLALSSVIFLRIILDINLAGS